MLFFNGLQFFYNFQNRTLSIFFNSRCNKRPWLLLPLDLAFKQPAGCSCHWSNVTFSCRTWYMLVSTLVTYYSNMSTSSSTTYLSATIPTTSTTSPTRLLLTLSSAQPPATSSNCTFYSLKMLLMTILASILVTLSATMGTSNSSCGMSWTLCPMSEVYQC